MNGDKDECPRCHHDWCSGVVYLQEDPFAAEIYDDHDLYDMCDGEAYESAQDI